MSSQLCAVIPTQDNIRTIQACLDSILPITQHIIVVDSGSSDGTVELCLNHGVEVIHHSWQGMVKQRQFCLEQARDYQWILVLDSDESLDKTLQNSIQQRLETETNSAIEAFSFNRKVWFLGGWLHYVFQPEHRLRVVRGGKAIVQGVGENGLGGHDQLVVTGQTAHLDGTCKHNSWHDLDDMLQSYIRLGRRAAQYDPKPSNTLMIFTNPLFAFLKQYILKQGYKDGRRGLIASAAIACGNLIKQLQKNQTQWFK